MIDRLSASARVGLVDESVDWGLMIFGSVRFHMR